MLSDPHAYESLQQQSLNHCPGGADLCRVMRLAAIGVGGEGFAASMRSAVEGVVGQVREESVSLRPSSAGRYISVTVGPVLVESGDQVRPSAANAS